MISLNTRVEGLEAVKIDLDMLHGRVRDQLKRAVLDASARVAAQAKANLSGGVLKARTGKLLSTVSWAVREGETNIHGRVGTDYYIGRFWEKGFNGAQQVKSHLRAIKSGSRFQAMKLSKRGRLVKGKLYRTGATQVKAYTRNTDGKPRPWLMTALDSVRTHFQSEVRRIAKENSSNVR